MKIESLVVLSLMFLALKSEAFSLFLGGPGGPVPLWVPDAACLTFLCHVFPIPVEWP